MQASRQRHRIIRPALLFAAVLTLQACAQTADIIGGNAPADEPPGGAQPVRAADQAASRFPDTPIPQGAKMNVDKTLVFGAPVWFGQLALESGDSAAKTYDFYAAQLPKFGWREITSVRSRISVLTFERQDRVMSITIEGTALNGSEVVLTVSPRGRGGGRASEQPAAQPREQVQPPPAPPSGTGAFPQAPPQFQAPPGAATLPPLSGPRRSPLLVPQPGAARRDLFTN